MEKRRNSCDVLSHVTCCNVLSLVVEPPLSNSTKTSEYKTSKHGIVQRWQYWICPLKVEYTYLYKYKIEVQQENYMEVTLTGPVLQAKSSRAFFRTPVSTSFQNKILFRTAFHVDSFDMWLTPPSPSLLRKNSLLTFTTTTWLQLFQTVVSDVLAG